MLSARLDHKVALVTGGASGMGKAIAGRFRQAGASVAAFDINAEGVKKLTESDGAVLGLVGDVCREDDAQRAVEETVARFGKLDVLVNCAGTEIPGTVVDLTSEGRDRQLAVNLKGPFLFSKYSIPHMRRRHSLYLVN